MLASIRIQSWLSDLCFSVQAWGASRRCSRAQNPSVSQREAWPLSTALQVIVIFSTSGGTDSILEKAPRHWCQSSLMVTRKKADSQLTSIRPACMFPCTSETPSPVTPLSTSVQLVSTQCSPGTCRLHPNLLCPIKAWQRAQSIQWSNSVSILCAMWFMCRSGKKDLIVKIL